jgi:hypothetical protein
VLAAAYIRQDHLGSGAESPNFASRSGRLSGESQNQPEDIRCLKGQLQFGPPMERVQSLKHHSLSGAHPRTAQTEIRSASKQSRHFKGLARLLSRVQSKSATLHRRPGCGEQRSA